MTLPQALIEAYNRAGTSTRHLMALDFQHALFPDGHIRIVNHDKPITLLSEAYAAHAMLITEPEVGTEPDNSVSMKIDGVPGTFQFWVSAAINDGTPIYVDMIPFAYNLDTNGVIGVTGTYKFKVISAAYDMTSVNLKLGHQAPTNMPFPGKFYSPATHPGMYK